MATERFSLDQFQQAVPEAENIGLKGGQYVFKVPVDAKTCIMVYSSIDSSGFAADTGADSIRFALLDTVGFDPIMGKIDQWTTRVAGWEVRVNQKIAVLKEFRAQAGNCKVCGEPLRIGKTVKPGPNQGRLYASCSTWAHNQFMWIKDVRDEDYSAPVAKKEFAPATMIGKLDFSFLNEEQQKVVALKGRGPVVVSAGAGSGKTRVLACDVANMIVEGIDPGKILVVTFSSKAAAEMRVRIAKTIWPDISEEELAFYAGDTSDEIQQFETGRPWVEANPIRKFLVDWVTTIHAMSFRILKLSGEKFNVCKDKWERQANDLIKDSLAELKWEQSPKQVRDAISTAINNFVDPNSRAFDFFRGDFPHVNHENLRKLAEIYKRYMAFMQRNNLVDFDMMQTLVYTKLKNDWQFRAMVKAMFNYILVDEGQDTGGVQPLILWMLAEDHHNITFIGDTRQSLYRWRGAVPEVMDSLFDERWGSGNVNRIGLPKNYRSTQTIVNQSNKLIKTNYLDRLKYLIESIAHNENQGEPIEYWEEESFADIVDQMAAKIMELGNPQDWFVLSRTRAECAAIHLGLIRRKIPAVNLSGGMLLGAPHIRKVLAYAQLACNWNNSRDNIEVLKEVANIASINFHAPITRRNHREGCDNQKSWVDCGCPIIMHEGTDHCHTRYYANASIDEAGNWAGIKRQMYDVNRGGFPSMKARGADDFYSFVMEAEYYIEDAEQCLRYIIENSVLPWLMHEEGLSSDDLGENNKSEDFDVILSMVQPGMSLTEFLSTIDNLNQQSSSSDDSVQVMTVHRSKGLERPYVIFNTTRCPIVPPKGKETDLFLPQPVRIEDERNLAYVAVTRAKDKVYMMGAREWNGQELDRSPFVYEMDTISPGLKEEMDREVDSDMVPDNDNVPWE